MAVDRSTKLMKYIDPDTGKRSDAAHGYIQPILVTQTNLRVLLQKKVRRVLFRNRKAIGVEYVDKYLPFPQLPDDSKLLNSSADQSCKTVFARKLVILSAGSLSTPQILERSGIGSSSILSAVGIRKTLIDLPGVGANYQDHNRGVAGVYKIDGVPDDTGDAFIRQDPDTLARWYKEYTTGQGPLAWNFVDAGSKLRPTMKELSQMGSAFKEVWDEIYEPNPDKATISTAIAAM